MKTAIFASIIAGAAAFAPAQQKASSTALNMAFENELGAQPPVSRCWHVTLRWSSTPGKRATPHGSMARVRLRTAARGSVRWPLAWLMLLPPRTFFHHIISH